MTKEQWIKEASGEELFEEFEMCLNELAKTTMFSVSYMEIKKELAMIKAEMLKRMK